MHKVTAEQYREEKCDTLSLEIKEMQKKGTPKEPAIHPMQKELDEAECLSEVEALE